MTLLYYLERLGLRLRWRNVLVYVKNVSDSEAEAVAVPDNVEVRVATSSDLQRLAYPGGWLDKPQALEWLSDPNKRMVAALDESSILGYCWLEMGVADLAFFDAMVPLEKDVAYLSHVFVGRASRRRGLGFRLVRAAERVVLEEGRTSLVAVCVPINSSVIEVFARCRWRLYGRLAYFRVARFAAYWVHDLRGRRRVTTHGHGQDNFASMLTPRCYAAEKSPTRAPGS